jgi:hypothetical protein
MMDGTATNSVSFLNRLEASGDYRTENLVILNSDLLEKSVREWLQAAGYDKAIACLDILKEKENRKFRQDGITPSWLHQLSQAVYTISLIEDGVYLADPEAVICLNFIHDVGEDHGIRPGQLKNMLIRRGVEDDDWLTELMIDYDVISKQYGKNGEPRYKSEFEYYEANRKRQNTSVAKLEDRSHNIATQVGVKGMEKIRRYISNTQVILNDFVRDSSKQFPEQKEAYEALQKIIETSVQSTRYLLAREEVHKDLPPDEEILAENMPERGFKVPKGLNPVLLATARVRKHYDAPYPVRTNTLRRRFKTDPTPSPK